MRFTRSHLLALKYVLTLCHKWEFETEMLCASIIQYVYFPSILEVRKRNFSEV